MGPEIQLRAVTAEDQPFLLDLFASTRPEIAQLGWGEAEQQAFIAMQFAMQSRSYGVQFPGAEHSIILYDTAPAGRMIVNRGELRIQLTDIAVLPLYRGRGIAATVIERLQEEAAEAKKPIELTVDRSNSNALDLYTKLGFEITGENQLHLSMRWTPNTTQTA